MIALDKNTLDTHSKDLLKKRNMIYDQEAIGRKIEGMHLPMKEFVNKIGGIAIMKNVVAIGALCYLFCIPMDIPIQHVREIYKKRAEPNVELIKMGYEYAKNNFKIIQKIRIKKSDNEFYTGNEALALGAVRTGLNLYFGYPMTPATSILHFLAEKRDEFGIKVVQPENEIAVINMAIGSAYAGKRSMVGSSGGGFALMQEAVSLSGMTETPILIVESQRPGPSTGVPTYTSQADLRFVIHSGQSDFPKIVLAPSDAEEAYYKSAEALNLAWRFQVPVILLIDKTISESVMSVKLGKVNRENVKISSSEDYKRYRITKDGISPLAFPGGSALVKACSYEHDEYGISTEDSDNVKTMQEKRFRKYEYIKKELRKLETVKEYGKGKNIIVTWGSAKGPVLDAVQDLDAKVLNIIYLKPFPDWVVKPILEKAKRIICVEGNYTGQLNGLIRENTGIEIKNNIRKYDSRPFNPLELNKELKRFLK